MYQALSAAVAPIEEASVLVVPPPAIQGIGNSGGFSMQVELRDGTGDFAETGVVDAHHRRARRARNRGWRG